MEISEVALAVDQARSPRLPELRAARFFARGPPQVDMDVPEEGAPMPPPRGVPGSGGSRRADDLDENVRVNNPHNFSVNRMGVSAVRANPLPAELNNMRFARGFNQRQQRRNLLILLNRRGVEMFRVGEFTTRYILRNLLDYGLGVALKRRYLHIMSGFLHLMFFVSLLVSAYKKSVEFLLIWLVLEILCNLATAYLRFMVHRDGFSKFTKFEMIILMLEAVPVVRSVHRQASAIVLGLGNMMTQMLTGICLVIPILRFFNIEVSQYFAIFVAATSPACHPAARHSPDCALRIASKPFRAGRLQSDLDTLSLPVRFPAAGRLPRFFVGHRGAIHIAEHREVAREQLANSRAVQLHVPHQHDGGVSPVERSGGKREADEQVPRLGDHHNRPVAGQDCDRPALQRVLGHLVGRPHAASGPP